MDEGAGSGEVGGNGVALAKMAGGVGPVAGAGGGGGCTGGRDGGCAEWIFGDAVYAVLEGFGEGVDVEYKGIKGLRGYGIKEKRGREAGGMKGENDFSPQLRDALTRGCGVEAEE